MNRRIACPDFSRMCVSIQVNYLRTKTCVDLTLKKAQLHELDTEIKQRWASKGNTYFEPTWLHTTQHFSEQRSATFDINTQLPAEAWHNAITNLEFRNIGDEWTNPKKAFYGLLIIQNDKEKTSHAIGIRKSHSQIYFIHDIHIDANSGTTVNGCTCKEYTHSEKTAFEKGLDSLLTQYHAHGYTSLFALKLIKDRPFDPFITSLKSYFRI